MCPIPSFFFFRRIFGKSSNVLTCYISGTKIQAEQDAQGEALGDPIILEGGDRANVDDLPHSRMLEQVGILPLHLFLLLKRTRPVSFHSFQLQTLLDSPMERPPI